MAAGPDPTPDAAKKPRAGRRAWEQSRQEQTRSALVEAATKVFVRDGFAATTIASITDEAGVSTGSFYNYFPTKEDILKAVVERIHGSFYGGTPSALDAPPEEQRRHRTYTYDELYARLERSHRRFLQNYRENAHLLQLLDEIPRVDRQFSEMRKRLRWRIVNANTHFIESLQRDGMADPDLDAWHAASALGAMVDRFAHIWFVMHEPFDEEASVKMLTTFWLRSLGVTPPQPATPRRASTSSSNRKS